MSQECWYKQLCVVVISELLFPVTLFFTSVGLTYNPNPSHFEPSHRLNKKLVNEVCWFSLLF